MNVKTERITILTTPDFKDFLSSEADREGISVSELIRTRCTTNKPADHENEQVLRVLVKQVNESTQKAQKALNKGLQDARQVLQALKETKVR